MRSVSVAGSGSGAVWVGDIWVGEVPVGSKEYHFLACLAQNLDQYVAYADIKHEVLRHSGSTPWSSCAATARPLWGDP